MRFFRRPLRTLASVSAYKLWAENYPAHAHNPLMTAEQDAMLELLPPLAGRTVLDLACGTGRYGRIAQERGAATVLGCDNSFDMLQRASIQQTTLATSEAIPLASNSVDVVLCGLALGHLPQLAPSLNEIGRILKPDGIALISDFHPFQFMKGALRTFKAADGTAYAVEHYPHLYADYHHATQQTGLAIVDIREPRLLDNTPVVLVLKLQKRG